MRVHLLKKQLRFKLPAQTSKCTYHTRDLWYLVMQSPHEPSKMAVGESAPLPHLSRELQADFTNTLRRAASVLEASGTFSAADYRAYPSILFALESVARQWHHGATMWDNAFSRGESGMAVNGLIWMGTIESMQQQIEEKLNKGFRCVKLKIGATDFEEELSLLKKLRQRYAPSELKLRVDANGAFSPTEVEERLQQLSRLSLHSIEQPIAVGQYERMAQLCRQEILPIALDEELIGITSTEEKRRLLTTLSPQYIVLKPTLHGGFSGAEEWIGIAREQEVGFWVTSALESNVGLQALAQWCGEHASAICQGLGTGQLFTENTPSSLFFRGEELWMKPPVTLTIDDLSPYERI